MVREQALGLLARNLLNLGGMRNVLVVDDDSHFREIMERVIRRSHSCSVKTAATEAEAWEQVSQGRCDLVLLDLHIDGKKSWDTLTRIGRLPDPPPVILVSCDDTKDNLEYAKSLGAVDFLPKPIDFARLKSTVDATLLGKREEKTPP